MVAAAASAASPKAAAVAGGAAGASPWTDFGLSMGTAEEAAAAVVEQIVLDGGTLLWQKYLERKAFGFAADAIVKAIASGVGLCYVTHDQGETPASVEEGEESDGWGMEEEPEPKEIDSWARMYLPVRRQHEGAPPGTGGSRMAGRSATSFARSTMSMRSRNSTDARQRPPRSGRVDEAKSRSMAIVDERQVDEEEEQLREAKNQEEAQKREKARQAKDVEKIQAEERKAVAAKHEEMRTRPHTFDQDGNIIWVEEVKAERLPRVQEAAAYTMRKGEKLQDTLRSTSPIKLDDSPATGSPKKRGGLRSTGARSLTKGSKTEPEFTDYFARLQHGQPPILETMVMQSGVSLQAMGKTKAGAPDLAGLDRNVMTRREYNRLLAGDVDPDSRGGFGGYPDDHARRESAEPAAAPPASAGGGGSVTFANSADAGAAASSSGAAPGAPGAPGAGGPNGGAGGAGAGGGLGDGGGSARDLGGGGGAGGTRSLPPLKRSPSRGGGPGPGGSGSGTGGAPSPPPQRAPPAPPMASRHMGKKFEAMGYLAFQRAPRYHVSQLGGPSGFGSPQPPIGATMGHGLVRHGSMKENYFFPTPQLDSPTGLSRSASDAALPMGSGRRAASALSGGGSLDEHGRMQPETTSPAYRNFRHLLLSEPSSTTQSVGGGRGGGGGGGGGGL